MKIAVINITAGGISGGYRKYLQHMIPLFSQRTETEEILCISPHAWGVENWFGNIEKVEFYSYKKFNMLKTSNKKITKYLDDFSPDVLLVPVERCFSYKNVPVVNMLQNMEPLAYLNEGNPLFEKLRNLLRARTAKKAMERADKIIAVSRFVRSFLMQDLKISESKIELIYYGMDDVSDCNVVKSRNIPIGWEEKFIFTAGSIRPARGLEDLLQAMRRLGDGGGESLHLVIAGEVSPNMVAYQNKLKRWIEEKGLQDRVCWTGGLVEEEMRWCYNTCKIFVMTSRVESFGQIALEALSQGAMCISTDSSCLPEIFGDAAIYYSPKDIDALVKAIQSVLRWGPQKQENVQKKAKVQAVQFSWDTCARKTVKLLDKILGDIK
ncbi:MAG: glycosyltransferase family 1 protein [Candidatus Aceula meridiana]|nr:glycosyltransferase family 1 protein [Candidatus Aceula meridiana]